MSKYNVGLKTLLQEGVSEHEWILMRLSLWKKVREKSRGGDNLDNSSRQFALIMAPFWLRNCPIQMYFDS